MECCRNCRYFEFGKCHKGLPIEVDNKMAYQIDNGELDMRFRMVFEDHAVKLDKFLVNDIIDDLVQVVKNTLIEDYEIKVSEDFKCKYYE